jgi:hypothetical protein
VAVAVAVAVAWLWLWLWLGCGCGCCCGCVLLIPEFIYQAILQNDSAQVTMLAVLALAANFNWKLIKICCYYFLLKKFADSRHLLILSFFIN